MVFKTGSRVAQATSNSYVAEAGLELWSSHLYPLSSGITCPVCGAGSCSQDSMYTRSVSYWPYTRALSTALGLIMCLLFHILVFIIHQTWICLFKVFIIYEICIFMVFTKYGHLSHPLLLEFLATCILCCPSFPTAEALDSSVHFVSSCFIFISAIFCQATFLISVILISVSRGLAWLFCYDFHFMLNI